MPICGLSRLSPGVLNFPHCGSNSEGLVRHTGVDKISFTGSIGAPHSCGTVGHNAFRVDFGIGFGGFKQSGVGREGGREPTLDLTSPLSLLADWRVYKSP